MSCREVPGVDGFGMTFRYGCRLCDNISLYETHKEQEIMSALLTQSSLYISI